MECDHQGCSVQHGQESLDNFLDQINEFHNTIKFTAEYSTERISFLDTTVILYGNTIHTDLYTKPTDTHQYLSLCRAAI